ncbi:MAG: 2OG-Fe(II) oxygenase [Kiloniellales bacterium]|nr:2OG-Fe(II) oxygenase [Kiloniellales bacterium]
MKYQEGLREGIGQVRQIGPEVFAMPMWSADYCKYVIKRVEEEQAFHRGQGYAGIGEHGAIKTTDVKLNRLRDVHAGYLRTYNNLLAKIIKKIWLVGVDPSDAFVTRYTMSSQTRLLRHIDQSSIVSMTLKLNDDYEGGELSFPRQNLTNKDVPIGDMVFFPSGCTHVHEVLPLISGKRYAITFWTKPHVPA